METLEAKDRRAWRSWLNKNAAKSQEIWLIYYKKNSDRSGVSYDEALEEALCFGWIDGKIQRMDEFRYAQRFTPRKPNSRWSALNIRRAERLSAAGKMKAAGLALFNSKNRVQTPPLPDRMPHKLEARFKQHRAAWDNFGKFPPHYRRMTTGWVASAKKEETRLKRLEKLIEFSAREERIPFM